MAMEAVWMTSAVHMNGSILPIMVTTSALFVNKAGANTTTRPAHTPQLAVSNLGGLFTARDHPMPQKGPCSTLNVKRSD